VGTQIEKIEQEKTEETENDLIFSISPFPLLPPVQIVFLISGAGAPRSKTLRPFGSAPLNAPASWSAERQFRFE
jgi:hypothetical protein